VRSIPFHGTADAERGNGGDFIESDRVVPSGKMSPLLMRGRVWYG